MFKSLESNSLRAFFCLIVSKSRLWTSLGLESLKEIFSREAPISKCENDDLNLTGTVCVLTILFINLTASAFSV